MTSPPPCPSRGAPGAATRAARRAPGASGRRAGGRILLLCLVPLLAAPAGPPLPAPSGFVTDKAEVIEDAWEARIVKLLGELERRTGTTLAVLTVQSTLPVEDEEYARRVMDLWRIGKGGGDRGALMLVAVQDRRVVILPGPRLRRLFPEERIDAIVEERIVPPFKEGHYGQGILSGLWALADDIAIDARVKLDFKPPEVEEREPERRGIGTFGEILGALVGLFVLGLLWFAWQDYRHREVIRTRGAPGVPPDGEEGPFRGGRGGGFGGAGRDR
jgi:uncharacterized protein